VRIGESNNIKSLTPILANVFMDGFVLTESILKDYQEYFMLKQDELGILTKYLNNQMSDFEILSIFKDDNSLRIEINDLNYCLMAEEIARENSLAIDACKVKLPFILIFKNIEHYSVSEVDNTGELKEITDYSIVENSQILFDQLIYLDKNTIEIGFSLWKYINGTGHNFLLLLSAKTVKVIEAQIELLDKVMKGDISAFK
jgi:hypothetical protein